MNDDHDYVYSNNCTAKLAVHSSSFSSAQILAPYYETRNVSGCACDSVYLNARICLYNGATRQFHTMLGIPDTLLL